MKKALALLASCTLFTGTAFAAASPSPWSEAYIERAAEIGITAFHNFDKSYTSALTREELCSLIVNTVEAENEFVKRNNLNPFTDTDSEDVLKAYELGIVNGMGDSLFMPEREVSRQEAAKIFSATLNLLVDDTDEYSEEILNTFNDSESIADWARTYSAHLASLGILRGDENDNFNPKGSITTEQGVALCVRIFDKVEEDRFTSSDMNIKHEIDGETAYVSWNGSGSFEVKISEKRNSYYPDDFDANVTRIMTADTKISFDVYPNKIYMVTVINSEGKKDSTEFTTDKFTTDYEHREDVRVLTDTFNSEETAMASMQTLDINVWQLSDDGEKMPSTLSITVNSAIAERVKAVFDEIFAGDEKFPIYSVGGFAWRAPMASGRYSEHNLGTAIDINPDHNYCLYSDGSTIGECYLPYESPYSITPYGDVIRAFEKYGFTWGGDAWRHPKDYMHFSYLGT